jgi:hypothetical protein
MVYHSSYDQGEHASACSCAILPLNTVAKGPAPATKERDIIDEVLDLYRANVLFRNFDVRNNADKLLIYLSIFVTACLKRERRARAPGPARLAAHTPPGNAPRRPPGAQVQPAGGGQAAVPVRSRPLQGARRARLRPGGPDDAAGERRRGRWVPAPAARAAQGARGGAASLLERRAAARRGPGLSTGVADLTRALGSPASASVAFTMAPAGAARQRGAAAGPLRPPRPAGQRSAAQPCTAGRALAW